ncbi:GTP pyrophosphokinase [Bacillus andreraoultii]|uniref:GTP pyrophosphokinase n=1 Tax=Bacillus andreraoultii TaxID=1499685 RepID=UPI000A91CA0F|nr:GTP pyrophosphokinase family protein [Bacillus andreraoultii]
MEIENMNEEIIQYETMLNEWKNNLLMYKFALDEINTKLKIISEDYQFIHNHNPIEHMKSRIKTPKSIAKKLRRKGLDLTIENVIEHIHDIAGVRITCSFISDIYRLVDVISNQDDITVLKIKDYIKNPKPNGYKSLHLLVTVPVFLTTKTVNVKVEIQIRTIAMDFWASLEHKIYYKFEKDVPKHLLDQLKEAADVANRLDIKMERLKDEMEIYKALE